MQLLAQCRPQDRNGGSCARVANGHHGYYWHESIRGAILLLEREGGLRWARVASLILALLSCFRYPLRHHMRWSGVIGLPPN